MHKKLLPTVLLAVMLGGKLLGLLGMVFFIPLMAVAYALVREDIQRRDERKPIPKNSQPLLLFKSFF